MRKIDKKSKSEQLFVLMLLTVACLGIFALTGCGGGQSCEAVQCNSVNNSSYSAEGISVPGCGGCFGCSKSCGSCLWPQSCRYVSLKADGQGTISGCDIQYYGSTGCLGCGYELKGCYSGISKVEDGDNTTTKVFYGSSDDGIFRFCIEFFRGDAIRGIFLGFSTAQWVSLAIMICYVSRHFKMRRTERKTKAIQSEPHPSDTEKGEY